VFPIGIQLALPRLSLTKPETESKRKGSSVSLGAGGDSTPIHPGRAGLLSEGLRSNLLMEAQASLLVSVVPVKRLWCGVGWWPAGAAVFALEAGVGRTAKFSAHGSRELLKPALPVNGVGQAPAGNKRTTEFLADPTGHRAPRMSGMSEVGKREPGRAFD
jgi:hypothetical protein